MECFENCGFEKEGFKNQGFENEGFEKEERSRWVDAGFRLRRINPPDGVADKLAGAASENILVYAYMHIY
jgi:hypothetical protein